MKKSQTIPNLKDHELKSLADKFIDKMQHERRLQLSSVKIYRDEIHLLLKKTALGADVSDLRTYLRTLAPATQWRKTIIWKKFLNQCPSPWNSLLDDIAIPRLKSKLPTFLTDEEIFRLEAVCYKESDVFRNRLLIGLFLQLGLRLSEVLNLKFADLEDGWIRLIRKGGKEQRLPLSNSLQSIISFYRNERLATADEWVFEGRLGGAMSPRCAQLLIKRLAEKANIQKRISPHSLRHTFASQLAAKGANLSALQEILGHQRLATTERYLHVTPEHLRETLSLLQRKPGIQN